jgi:hypothetical protein
VVPRIGSVVKSSYAVCVEHALLEQIATGGADDELGQLRVYADERISRGDSFGELIVVATERLARDNPELARREVALIAQHTERLNVLLGRRKDKALDLGAIAPQTFRWRHGFVDAIEFDYAGDEPFAVLPVLAAEPAIRLVRRLAWAAVEIGGSGDMAPIFAELAGLAARFPRLVEIAVREAANFGNPYIDGAVGLPIDLHDVTPLYAAFPKLEVLELDGDDVELGDIALPSLRRFKATKLALEDIRRIVAAQLPKLEELELGFRYGRVDNIAAMFGPLLHRDFGPQLEALSIAPPTIEALRWVMAELPSCPLARHVRRLAFRGVELGDDLLLPLIANAGAWKRLERLELRERPISAATLKQLVKTFGSTLALV